MLKYRGNSHMHEARPSFKELALKAFPIPVRQRALVKFLGSAQSSPGTV